MPHLMRSRNGSVVYFEQKIDVTKTLPFLKEFRDRTGLKITMLHLLMWAATQMLAERPRLNRFVAGGRIYQRRGIWISYSGKKGKSDQEPLFTMKRQLDPSWDLEKVVQVTDGSIAEGRGEKPTGTDKELALVFMLPNVLIHFAVWLVMCLDNLGLLPWAYMRGDPMFASVFVASMGSLGFDAGFHHLYEYGNIPIFVMAGAVKDEVVPGPDGIPQVAPRMTLRYTFDERIEDGLYSISTLQRYKTILEDPAAWLAGKR